MDSKQALLAKAREKVVVFYIFCFTWTFQCTIGKSNDTFPPKTETWKLTAAAEPKPALKYSFWPAQNEFKRGNAVVNYQRAHMQLPANVVQQLGDALKGDNQLSDEQAKSLIATCASSWTEILRATYRKEIAYDLGLDQLTAQQKLDIAIPEVEHAIALGNLIRLHIRLAIEERRFADAVEAIKAGFRCAAAAREVGGSILADMVCLHIIEGLCAHLEELVQIANAPNLYWAIASIPQELLNFSDSIMAEATMWEQMVTEWTESRPDVTQNGDWRKRLAEVIRMLNSEKSTEDLTSRSAVSDARGRLLEAGLAPERIQSMCAEEAVLTAMRYEFQVLQDDRKKWLLLSEEIQLQHARQLRDSRPDSNADNGAENVESGYAHLVERMQIISSPVLTGVKAKAINCRQRFARLATTEALRDHVAVYGQFPERLSDLIRLPAWPNPVTGQHFGYEKIAPLQATLKVGLFENEDQNGQSINLKAAP